MSVPFSFRMDDELASELDKYAKMMGVSKGKIVRNLLSEWVGIQRSVVSRAMQGQDGRTDGPNDRFCPFCGERYELVLLGGDREEV